MLEISKLCHSFLIPHTPDIVAKVKTFLTDTIPSNYGQIQEYTSWHRKYRLSWTFGSVAVCFTKNLSETPLDVALLTQLEMMCFKI